MVHAHLGVHTEKQLDLLYDLTEIAKAQQADSAKNLYGNRQQQGMMYKNNHKKMGSVFT